MFIDCVEIQKNEYSSSLPRLSDKLFSLAVMLQSGGQNALDTECVASGVTHIISEIAEELKEITDRMFRGKTGELEGVA